MKRLSCSSTPPRAATDALTIRNLRARCILGVEEWERAKKQEVLITVVLRTDLRRAGRTDRLEDSVDYKAVKERILDEVERSSFHLLERLAECVADVCLSAARVRQVEVTIQKPGALRFAQCAEIAITRRHERGHRSAR